MTGAEAIETVRYVVYSDGEKTAAVVPMRAWETLLAAWRQVLEMLEDQEDMAVLRSWLAKREVGEADMIPLGELERERLCGERIINRRLGGRICPAIQESHR